MRHRSWRTYGFEFLSIFIAVTSAFALNNWSENRRSAHAESRILEEIRNGLALDLVDVAQNIAGHRHGIAACHYWEDVICGNPVDTDSLHWQFLTLTRDFISVQNTSGYENLKSRGLELIQNDSLRTKIISLYEYDYNTLKKFEESYFEMQFQANYFQTLNDLLGAHLTFGDDLKPMGLRTPLSLTEGERSRLLTILWKIKLNRQFVLYFYQGMEKKIADLRQDIELLADA